MVRLWVLYNFLVLILIFGTSLSSARSLTNFLLPLLLLPLLYYLGKEVLKKPRKRKLADPAVFTSSVTNPARIILAGNAEEGTAMPGLPAQAGITDDNRRLFLKLVGSTSLSMLFMVLIGKGSAKAAFFGSIPGPGTITIKDSSGVAIDPSEKQPTDGYTITEVDDSSTPSYYGFLHKTGAWYITKEDSAGSYRYAKGASLFSTGWTGRALLTYDYFDNVF